MKTSATIWLRFEGLAVLGMALVLYHHHHLSWTWFAVLFLSPDLSMLGYLAGPRVGAFSYNLAHTYAFGLAVFALGFLTGNNSGLMIGLILCAHSGFDRALGYGLKLTTGFRETHLGRVGQDRPGEAAR